MAYTRYGFTGPIGSSGEAAVVVVPPTTTRFAYTRYGLGGPMGTFGAAAVVPPVVGDDALLDALYVDLGLRRRVVTDLGLLTTVRVDVER